MIDNLVGYLTLGLLILLFVVLLCWRDKKRKIGSTEEKIEEIKDKVRDENIEDNIDPRKRFEYIIARYFDEDYKEGFFKIYIKLLDKVSDISKDSRCNSYDFERYSDLTRSFFDFCVKSESYTIDLFDYKEYGSIEVTFY